ncbi:hypothetical protein VTN02DRAFT_6776 [Thermoascus thermophilus]
MTTVERVQLLIYDRLHPIRSATDVFPHDDPARKMHSVATDLPLTNRTSLASIDLEQKHYERTLVPFLRDCTADGADLDITDTMSDNHECERVNASVVERNLGQPSSKTEHSPWRVDGSP